MPKKKKEGKGVLLTKSDKSYIENNLNKADLELATDTGKPVQAIRDYIHNVKTVGRISKLMVREKGCVVMTEGASEAADKARRGYVSETAIQAAATRGDYEEAARLQKEFREQQARTVEGVNARQPYIHYIDGSMQTRR